MSQALKSSQYAQSSMATIISNNIHNTFFLAYKQHFPRSFLTARAECYYSAMYVVTEQKTKALVWVIFMISLFFFPVLTEAISIEPEE